MSNKERDSHLLIGAVIGGVIGLGAIGLYFATKEKSSCFGSIGKTLSRIGKSSTRGISKIPL